MRLVFVHGINQQNKTTDQLLEEWGLPLRTALKGQGFSEAISPEIPYYGNLLFNKTIGADKGHVTPQGIGDAPTPTEEAEFLETALNEMAAESPVIDEEEVARLVEQGTSDLVVGQGFPMHRRINAVARAIERHSPLHGEWALRLLKQAYTYLKVPGVADKVDALVEPYLRDGPTVIVAHSLGTIVTYRILREKALMGSPLDVPLLVTVGSPLSLRTVRTAIKPKYFRPERVSRWLNAYDPDDFVSLGQGLTASTFSDKIENIGDIRNVPDDAHAITGYVADARVAAAIGQALLGEKSAH